MLALRPFVADDLPAVEPWFDEAETRRRLGDRAWPRRLLALVDPPARMAVVAVEHGAPVALADVEIDADGRAALAVVVAPSARRRRVATRLLADLTHAPALAAARELYGTVEPGNRASERLLRGAGFRPDGVDRDGFARFALTLPPRW